MVVLAQVARGMIALGQDVRILVWEEPTGASRELLAGLRIDDIRMNPPAADEMFIVPEGWPNALAFGLRAGCQTVIYCQNWSFLFQGLEEGVRWRGLPVDFLAVSDPIAWHLEQVLGKRPFIIRPSIDRGLFHPPVSRPDGPVRIGFMPRKNKALAEQIRRIFEERNPKAQVQWVPIHGLDRSGVAEALRSCHVFLVTGFPEGCPLPPLEAMACGCLCAGFTGFGGWDYMRQMEPDGFSPHGYRPRNVSWGGNGWWVADGDVLGAAKGLERAVARIGCTHVEALEAMLEAYSEASQNREIQAWAKTF
ncbi:MAG: glycosyltransferase [Deltaproteobacteria bacterium]|nr:glycosyltransferase [Deltaproteobacteria bacterium]